MKYLFMKGVQYEGETNEQMAAREKAMEDHNRRDDERIAEERRQKAIPLATPEWIERHRYELAVIGRNP